MPCLGSRCSWAGSSRTVTRSASPWEGEWAAALQVDAVYWGGGGESYVEVCVGELGVLVGDDGEGTAEAATCSTSWGQDYRVSLAVDVDDEGIATGTVSLDGDLGLPPVEPAELEGASEDGRLELEGISRVGDDLDATQARLLLTLERMD